MALEIKNMNTKKRKPPEQREVAPMTEHEKAMQGLLGTPKAEVDAEERKQRHGKPQKRSSTRRKQSR